MRDDGGYSERAEVGSRVGALCGEGARAEEAAHEDEER